MGKQLQQLILTRFFQHLVTNFKYSVTKKNAAMILQRSLTQKI